MRDIDAGVCLGEYDGELINEETYWTRYPSGVVRSTSLAMHASRHALVAYGQHANCSQPHMQTGQAQHRYAAEIMHGCSQTTALASTGSGLWMPQSE